MDKMQEKCDEFKGQFDTEEPTIGHFERFTAKLERLDERTQGASKKTKQMASHWKWLSIAASILLVVGYYFSFQHTDEPQEVGLELAAVSPEMEETQSFFTMTIQHELKQVNAKRTADNQVVIDDALEQLEQLEKKYTALKIELANSDYDRRIVIAMITNFQQRVEVLQALLVQLDEIETLKRTNYDDKII